MKPSLANRLLLGLSGLMALWIGAAILIDPTAFHAGNGITLGADPSLLSEVRAPGGALLVLGGLMLAGAFVRALTFASTAVAAAVYLAYGLSRLLAMALDGMPATGLVGATAIELATGTLCLLFLPRAFRSTAPRLEELNA